MDQEFFMEKAYEQAVLAFEQNETPIGCVIVYKNEIIASGYNQRNTYKNALYHAEIIAINKASEVVKDWRLEECTLFVTIEPCPMCAGAIVQARIPRVVYGAANVKAGCAGSVLNILNCEKLNHQAEVIPGILEEKCSKLMSDFFVKLRNKV